MVKLFPMKFPGSQQRQKAQGMVEFALVLPILLLVMFGIFAFSHLLFSYTLVVSASREAARFGVATGLSDSNLPRFRDCDAIRAAAIRAGSFAGVQPGNITITYDKGPKLDGSDADVHPDACPIGGVGPGYVEIGDRIVVSIQVPYRTIVPLGFIPNMNLNSVTRRTIIRALPIGDAPIAPGSVCIGTITRIVPPPGELFSTSDVGEEYTFTAEVITDDPGIIAPGTLKIYLDDATYTTAADSGATGGSTSTLNYAKTWVKGETGEHVIRAEYIPTPPADPATDPCYNPSKAEPWLHYVEPADTELTILTVDPVSPTGLGQPFIITVDVTPVLPGDGIPEGPVEIKEGDVVIGTFNVGPVVGLPGKARGTSAPIYLTPVGLHTLTLVYDPGNPGVDPDFNESLPVDYEHEIEPYGTVLSILSTDPGPVSYPDETVTLNVQVSSLTGGSGAPVGPVVLMENDIEIDRFYVFSDLSYPADSARGSVNLPAKDVGEYTYQLIFDPDYINENLNFSDSLPVTHTQEVIEFIVIVLPADTVLTVVSHTPLTPEVNQAVRITVNVRAVDKTKGIPTGPVVMKENGVVIATFPVGVDPSIPNYSSATVDYNPTTEGTHILTFIYDPGDPGANPDFAESPPVDYTIEVSPPSNDPYPAP